MKKELKRKLEDLLEKGLVIYYENESLTKEDRFQIKKQIEAILDLFREFSIDVVVTKTNEVSGKATTIISANTSDDAVPTHLDFHELISIIDEYGVPFEEIIENKQETIEASLVYTSEGEEYVVMKEVLPDTFFYGRRYRQFIDLLVDSSSNILARMEIIPQKDNNLVEIS